MLANPLYISTSVTLGFQQVIVIFAFFLQEERSSHRKIFRLSPTLASHLGFNSHESPI